MATLQKIENNIVKKSDTKEVSLEMYPIISSNQYVFNSFIGESNFNAVIYVLGYRLYIIPIFSSK